MCHCFKPFKVGTFLFLVYSGDLKSDHLKSGLFEGQISNGQAFAMAKAIVPTIQKPDNLSRFQMVGLPDSRSHSKSRPFETQPIFDDSKSRLVLCFRLVQNQVTLELLWPNLN